MVMAITRAVPDSPGQVTKGWLRMSDTVIINIIGVSDISRVSDGSEGIIFNQDIALRFDYVNAATADAKFEEIYSLFEAMVIMNDLR